MAANESPAREWIVSTPSVLGGKPRVEGRRLGVHFLATQVVDGGESSERVAARYELPTEAVDAAVEYYHAHPEEMANIEARRRERLAEAQADSSVPTTPEEVAELVAESESATE